MSPTRRAVVTGIGLLTPVGRGAPESFAAVCAGRSGLHAPRVGSESLALDVAGVVDLDVDTVLSPTDARTMDRFIPMALAATDDAMSDAEIVVGQDVDPGRVAVVVSCAAGGLGTFGAQAAGEQARGRAAVSPYLLPGILPNMAAAQIAIRLGARGYSTSISTACAAGAQAVIEALRLIRDSIADVVVCGGADAPLNPTVVAAFSNARALARGWPVPEEASRPFDRRRNGFVLGEGAAVLVVESAAFARARGARGYADLAGWATTTDAYHRTSPRPDGSGAAQAMRLALADADLPPSAIGYLNAHGTSTKLGDSSEAQAIRSVFGSDGPAVSSTKGVTGHLLGAAGALEAAVTAMALANGTAPPTRNLDDPDPACELDHVTAAPRRLTANAAMSNSFAFGGHNVSIVLTPTEIDPRPFSAAVVS